MKDDNANPYVGLRPFEMDESILFFGRNNQTLELLQRLHQHHFLAVVGTSGCGKSSLLRAGLIPALKGGYLVDDSDHWFIVIMKPGQSPLFNLVEAIFRQVNSDADPAAITALLQQVREEGADVLIDLLTPVSKGKNINFFLLVDQFEELFRFAMEKNDVKKKDEAIDFVNIMLELSRQDVIPFYITITMRSDFIGDCAEFFGLPEAMNKSQYLVPRLNRMQLKAVIEGPAKLFGSRLNPSLTSHLLNEIGHLKDELPLLQHALMRIWDQEKKFDKNSELDLGDYHVIGGLEKALSNHADEALAGMSNEQLRISKEMFQALTAIDESGRKIRRPVLLSQLTVLTNASEEQVLAVIDLFIKDGRSFLVINKAGDSNDKIIDISHESLIRQWNTLSQWVDEEGESAAMYLQLAEAENLYSQKKKDLLTGSELQLAIEWRNKFNPAATWANRYKPGYVRAMEYLKASETGRTTLRKVERRRRKNLRLLIWGVVFSLLIAGYAIEKDKDNQKQSKETADKNLLLLAEQAKLKAKNDTLAHILDDLKKISVTADAKTQQKLDALQVNIKADVEATNNAAGKEKTVENAKEFFKKANVDLKKVESYANQEEPTQSQQKNILNELFKPASPVNAPPGILSDRDIITNYITRHKQKDTVVVVNNAGAHVIGYGFNLDKSDSREKIQALGLSYEKVFGGEQLLNDGQIKLLFTNDLTPYTDKIKRNCPGYESLDVARRAALLDLTLLIGTKQFSSSGELIKAVNASDWRLASEAAEKIPVPEPIKKHTHEIGQALLNGQLENN